MPSWRYRARSADGALRQGSMEAPSTDVVASRILEEGGTPLEITLQAEQGAARTSAISSWLPQRKVDLDDMVLFSRQMYSLLKAGVTMLPAIRGLAETTRNPVLAAALRDIAADLQSGRELSSAMLKHPRIFSSLYIGMVQVGENTGLMDTIFQRLGEHLAREKEIRDKVKAAMRYPTIVVVILGVALAVINVFVIPAFAGLFSRSGMELPLPTRFLIGFSDFTVQYWPHILVGMVAVFLALRQYVRTPGGRYKWDRFKLRIPIFGDLLQRALLSRFAAAFALSYKAGVPLVGALGLVARAADNVYLEQRVENMRASIERGDGLTRGAQATGLFTPLVLQMLSVGEETGAVDEMMEEVAGHYEREVDYDLKNLSSMIEPILTVMVGGMILVLALGVFLPMWDMTRAIR
ncbi:type II secretion system F family protein [Desulfonatronum parangueonense]